MIKWENAILEHRRTRLASEAAKRRKMTLPDDSMNIVDLLLVTDLEIKPNGRSHRGGKRH